MILSYEISDYKDKSTINSQDYVTTKIQYVFYQLSYMQYHIDLTFKHDIREDIRLCKENCVNVNTTE